MADHVAGSLVICAISASGCAVSFRHILPVVREPIIYAGQTSE